MFHPCSKIPVPDYFIALFFVLDCNSGKSSLFEHHLQFLHGNCASDSANVGVRILFDSIREFPFFEDIRNCKATSRL